MASVVEITCPECNQSFLRTSKQINAVLKRRPGPWVCQCVTAKMNKEKARPIGSTRINANGYVLEKTAGGWIQQHRIVMEKYLARKISTGELVHHIDGNKLNNQINNLRIEEWGDHTAHHHTGAIRSKETKARISAKNCKYSIDQARRIRVMVSDGISQRQAGKIVGVPQNIASRIARNLIYKEEK